jgi:hypothetical protein
LSTTCPSCPFDLVHSNVWGTYPFVSKGGRKHYVAFVDDNSQYTWVNFIKHRVFALVHTHFPLLFIFCTLTRGKGGGYLSTCFINNQPSSRLQGHMTIFVFLVVHAMLC